ncbi:MAG: hypothetical protein Q4C67_11270 [Deinococcus sp.]|nr:hypothetical protein [Deinococcus sp.]
MTKRLRAEIAFLIAFALLLITAGQQPAEARAVQSAQRSQGALALPTTFTVYGTVIQVREGRVPGGQAGVAEQFLNICRVTVQDAADRFTVLHEVGHCVDDGMRVPELNAYACRVRLYACQPDEGAADLYALGWMLTYGPDLRPLLGLEVDRPALSAAQARARVAALLANWHSRP